MADIKNGGKDCCKLSGRVILTAILGGEVERIEFPLGGDAAVFADHSSRYPVYAGYGSFRGPLAGLLAHEELWQSVTVKCLNGDIFTFEWERIPNATSK